MTLEQIRQRKSEIKKRNSEIEEVLQRFAKGEEVEGIKFEDLENESTELRSEMGRLKAQELSIMNSADFTRGGMPTTKTETSNVFANKVEMIRSEQYRSEFQEYIRSGRVGELLKRANATTLTTDTTAVIVPTTITSQLFVTNQQAGTLYDLVTKTNYPFGVEYPLSDSAFELTWLAENSTSDTKKGESTTKISFTGYKAQIQFAISYETTIKALPDFEKAMIQKMQEGIRLSFDKIILNGTGTGQPKGILSESIYTKAVQFNDTNISTYDAQLSAFAKIPLAKKGKSVLVINNTDWLNYLVGIKDSNDRVVAFDTVGFGGMPQATFMGRPVIVLENQGLKNYASITGSATASATTCFGFWGVLSDYQINMNSEIRMRKYIKEETDEEVTKMTLLADGKCVNLTSFVPLCKKANAA